MDQLIKDNMGLVKSIATRFKPRNDTEWDDYIDAGRIGLWKALKKYEKGNYKVSTYVYRHILWEIIKEMRLIHSHQSVPLDVKKYEPNITYNYGSFWDCVPDDCLLEQEKKILSLRLIGHTFTEVSVILNKSRTTIQSRYEIAIKKIQEYDEQKKDTCSL